MIKIWLIYQGKESIKYKNDLVVYFESIRAQNKIELCLTKYNESNASKLILTSIDKDINDCDGAIAIITKDPRRAHLSGNLWLEIGLWLGSKRRSNLLICKQDGIRSRNLTSDMLGIPLKSFANSNKLALIAEEFAIKLKEEKLNEMEPNTKSYNFNFKINDTFSNGDSTWIPDSSYECYDNNGKICDFKKASLEFNAELLRMGRFNKERDALKDILYRASELAVSIADWSDIKKSSSKAIQSAVLSLKERIDQIRLFIDYYLFEGGREYEQKWTSQERFIAFLKGRLNLAVSLFNEEKKKKINIFFDEASILDLIERLEDYLNKTFNINKINIQQFTVDEKFRKEIQEYLFMWREDTGIIISALELIGNSYFESCRECIKMNLANIKDPIRVNKNLTDLVFNLPHNDPENMHMCIWPIRK